MNLNELKTKEAIVLHVRHPETGEPLYEDGSPVTITLRGMHTDVVQEEIKAQGRRKREAEKKGEATTAEQDRKDNAAIYAAATISWTGHDEEFSRKAAQLLYEPEEMIWLRSQIDDKLKQHGESIKK